MQADPAGSWQSCWLKVGKINNSLFQFVSLLSGLIVNRRHVARGSIEKVAGFRWSFLKGANLASHLESFSSVNKRRHYRQLWRWLVYRHYVSDEKRGRKVDQTSRSSRPVAEWQAGNYRAYWCQRCLCGGPQDIDKNAAHHNPISVIHHH